MPRAAPTAAGRSPQLQFRLDLDGDVERQGGNTDGDPRNGPEFIAMAVKGWIGGVGARTAFIEPGSPWENGYVESFNGKMRDELLAAEVFNTLLDLTVMQLLAGAAA